MLKQTPASLPPRRELHNLQSLEQVYGTPHSTVYDWFKRGLLTKVKIGGRTYVRDADMQALIARSVSGGKAA